MRGYLLRAALFAPLLTACSPVPSGDGLTATELQALRDRERPTTAWVLSVEDPESRRLLEQPSRPIDPRVPELPALIAVMERAARVYGGMGIAAVQVGVPVRLALLRRDNGRGEFQAFLNPELLWASGELSDSWENCLSVPWGYRHTSRPREIRVRYQTVSGLTRIETLMHDEAVVFQQELDHMDGALLSEGHDRRWFIPKDEIAGFVTEMGKLCREIPEAECRKLIQARIAARAGAAPP